MDIIKTLKWNDYFYDVSILSVITVLYFCKQSFTNFATAIGISTSIVAALILIPFLVLFGIHFIVHLRYIKWDAIVLYILCILLFIVTIKIHPEYANRYEDVYNNGRFSARAIFSLGAGIYTFYIIRLFGSDMRKLYNVFKIVPYIVFFLNLGTLINRSSEYAMDFGYQMGMAAILFIAQFLYEEERKIGKLVFSFLAIFFGIIYGARATVLGYVVFIALFMVWQKRMTLKKGILLCIGVIGGILYSSRSFMMWLYNFIYSLGLNSRTLYLIASGDVLSADTARQERIWPVLNSVLKESSLFKMYGAFGDRYYLNPHYPYAHNIIYEMLFTFGKFFGSIILISIIITFVLVCIRNKSEGGLMALIFGSFSICRLLISSSFWTEPYFWAFLATLVNCCIYYRNYEKGRVK